MEAAGRGAGFPNPQPATRNPQPRGNVLMKAFLQLESSGDDDNRTIRKKVPQQRGEKGLRGLADARARHSASLLQSPLQGLHGGSTRDGGEKTVCHRTYRIICQARSKSHDHGRCVKRRGENDE